MALQAKPVKARIRSTRSEAMSEDTFEIAFPLPHWESLPERTQQFVLSFHDYRGLVERGPKKSAQFRRCHCYLLVFSFTCIQLRALCRMRCASHSSHCRMRCASGMPYLWQEPSNDAPLACIIAPASSGSTMRSAPALPAQHQADAHALHQAGSSGAIVVDVVSGGGTAAANAGPSGGGEAVITEQGDLAVASSAHGGQADAAAAAIGHRDEDAAANGGPADDAPAAVRGPVEQAAAAIVGPGEGEAGAHTIHTLQNADSLAWR